MHTAELDSVWCTLRAELDATVGCILRSLTWYDAHCVQNLTPRWGAYPGAWLGMMHTACRTRLHGGVHTAEFFWKQLTYYKTVKFFYLAQVKKCAKLEQHKYKVNSFWKLKCNTIPGLKICPLLPEKVTFFATKLSFETNAFLFDFYNVQKSLNIDTK